MKAKLPPIVIPFALATLLPAETCWEVVRDSSGRIVQTIDRQKQSGGTVQAVTRDASGRIIGNAITRPSTGGGASTQYRDASGRLTGSAATQTTAGSSRSTYRDASGTTGRQHRHQRQHSRIVHQHPTRRQWPSGRHQHRQREMPECCEGPGSAVERPSLG